jgi:glyoxylase-like metal-dependent hydrolase (beta-lactamase superfamily II)/rhodanese-related sulfurtransferase
MLVNSRAEGVTMYFKQFLHDDLGCSSYFIASRDSREAVVIDPQYDIEQYLDLATERGYHIIGVVDTHLHADHISGNRRLAKATGAKLYLHRSADVRFPFEPLDDGDELHLGQVILRVVHTPGHRPESISLLVTNPPRSPEPSVVLSGDTLFVGDVGRPDFGGPEGALEQFESVQRLLGLPDYVEVFPAHFEGSCGKGMCGRPSSTIGFERRFNPLLQLPKGEFLSLAEEAPARPLNMTAIMATNQGDNDYEWVHEHGEGEPPVHSIEPKDGPAWIAEHHAMVLDVREPSEYAERRIPGAVSIPQADLATRMAEIPRDRDVLVACAGGVRSIKAAGFLKSAGFEHVTNLLGGTDGWQEAGNPVDMGEAAVV